MIRLLILVFLIALLGWVEAGRAADRESAALHVKTVEGEGVAYAPGSRATRGVSVLVTDETGRPVGDAIVSFTLPMTGPSGEFVSGTRTEIVTTKGDGRASVWGMRWNRLPGPFELRMTAIKGQSRADLAVNLELSGAPSKTSAPSSIGGGNHKWLWIGLGGIAAVAGAVAAGYGSKGSGSSSGPSASPPRPLDRDADDQSGASMKWLRFTSLVISCAALHQRPAAAQIQQPQLGNMLDSEGFLRPIFGVAASASLGSSSLAGVNSFACSSTLCLATTNSAMLSFPPSTPAISATADCACPGPALISLDHDGGAWVYFQNARQISRWRNGASRVDRFHAQRANACTPSGEGRIRLRDSARFIHKSVRKRAPTRARDAG